MSHSKSPDENARIFTRTASGNRKLTYRIRIFQQPQLAKACQSETILIDPKPVDPPPVISLVIFENRDGIEEDITPSYSGSFIAVANLDTAETGSGSTLNQEESRLPSVLSGPSVSGAHYLRRPFGGIFFIFPDLHVPDQGIYKLCFNLYENIKDPLELDESTKSSSTFAESRHLSGSDNPQEEVKWRMKITSAEFSVYSAKDFPGFSERTALTRTLADQGCLVTLRNEAETLFGRATHVEDEGYVSRPGSYPKQLPKPQQISQDGEILDVSTSSPVKDKTGPNKLFSDISFSELDQYQLVANDHSGSSAYLPMNEHLAPRPEFLLQRKHRCPYCGTEFTRHHNLKSHLLTHSQEKPYECQNCRMRFRRLHDLKRHMTVHDGEKLFVCLRCNRKFARADALARHSSDEGGCAGSSETEEHLESSLNAEDSDTEAIDAPANLHVTSSPYPYPTQISEENRRQLNTPSIKAQQSSDTLDAFNSHNANKVLSKKIASKEEIWLNLIACWEPATSSRLRYSDDGTTIKSTISSEPHSHAIKLQCQEWWLAHSSESWDDILSEHRMMTRFNPKSLVRVFLSWYQDLKEGTPGSMRKERLILPSDTIYGHEEMIIEQIVHDICLHLGRAAGSLKTSPGGNSTPNERPTSSLTTNHKSSGTSKNKGKGKRTIRSDAQSDDDGGDDDEPNQNDRTKRIKKTTNEYNRYVICPQFAAGKEPSRPNCFFGAWCSVDRLKQDHLINVHNFNTSQLKIDRGGTESEKWWRLFDKLNPGFRRDNPEAFIPGPFWEDRVAHNTYNKIFSEAMKRAERIREMRTQNLASDIQNLLNRQRDVERQEIRQVVLDVLHSRSHNATSDSDESPDITQRMESESGISHRRAGSLSTPEFQQPNTDSVSLSPLDDRPLQNASENNLLSLPSSSTGSSRPSLHGIPSDVHEPVMSSLWELPQEQSSMGTQSSYDDLSPQLPDILGGQFGVDLTMTTTSSSDTTLGTSSNTNDLVIKQPVGKVCRCRLHRAECDLGAGKGNEWCACCTGWFPWSAFAELFIMR
ncbi:Velvet factor domain containing protein [Hyaloscypha variabilis]